LPTSASDKLVLRSDSLDPIRECRHVIRERLHDFQQEFADAAGICGCRDELAMFTEELAGVADIGFGLLNGARSEARATA
jgi:hypothetical protein